MRQISSASGGIVTRSRSSDERDRLGREFAHQPRLLSRIEMLGLHVFERGVPVVPEPELGRRQLQLLDAPRVFALRDRDQFGRRVGEHFVLEVDLDRLRPDRVSDDRLVSLRLDSHDLLRAGRSGTPRSVSAARVYGSSTHQVNSGSYPA